MREEIEKRIVIHETLGPLEKWYKVTYNFNNEEIQIEFWGYDALGIAYGGKTQGDWIK
jgi:hypothetical protein